MFVKIGEGHLKPDIDIFQTENTHIGNMKLFSKLLHVTKSILQFYSAVISDSVSRMLLTIALFLFVSIVIKVNTEMNRFM